MCEIIYLDENSIIDDVIVALGEFDGVHLGHQELLNVTKNMALKHNVKSAMITFDSDPDYLLGRREFEGYLTPIEEKSRILSILGIDYLFVIKFVEISDMTPEEFYESYLLKFKGVVCGDDFRFGHKALGDASFLKDKFEICEIVNRVLFYNKKIGSSEIREFLSRGNINLVNELLGRPYSVNVLVDDVEYDALCAIELDCFIPREGTYKCEYFINEYESCFTSCIIEGTSIQIIDCNNVNVGDFIRVQLLEYIESGV